MGFVEMFVYSIIGALVGAGILFLVLHYSKIEMKGGRRAGVLILWILGILAIAFGIDWAYASTLEGEPQSSAMGLLIFGGIGIVLAIIGFRVGRIKPASGNADAANAAAAEAEAA